MTMVSDDTIQCPLFLGEKRRPGPAPSTTSTNSFVAEIIEVIIKAVCIVDSCVKLMRGAFALTIWQQHAVTLAQAYLWPQCKWDCFAARP